MFFLEVKNCRNQFWFLGLHKYFGFYCRRYLILLQMRSNFSDRNNTKYLASLWALINPSNLWNLIHNGFSTSKVLYEIPYSKRFPYDFLFITMLPKSKFSETNINFFWFIITFHFHNIFLMLLYFILLISWYVNKCSCFAWYSWCCFTSSCSLFHMKIFASVTKRLHEDCGPCYLHLTIFSYTQALLFCWKIKICCDCCFPQQIRLQTTVQWYILRDCCFPQQIRLQTTVQWYIPWLFCCKDWFCYDWPIPHTAYCIRQVSRDLLSFSHYCFTKSWTNYVGILKWVNLHCN